MSEEIRFEVRKRQRRQHFCTVCYDPANGRVLSVESGENVGQNRLVVPLDRVRNILLGKESQDHYLVTFNKSSKVMELTNVYKPVDFDPYWKKWLSESESESNDADLTCLILENRILRVEANRNWCDSLKGDLENLRRVSVYLTEKEDPHEYLGKVDIPVSELVDQGYAERRLYSFLSPGQVDALVAGRIDLRVNVPPLAKSIALVRKDRYFPYAGCNDDQTSVGHPGRGRDITIFVEDSTLWAQSHYHVGSPIDMLSGSLRIATFADDPEDFLGWHDLPVLLLRQNEPFVLAKDWHHMRPVNVLYKQSKIDIGVLH